MKTKFSIKNIKRKVFLKIKFFKSYKIIILLVAIVFFGLYFYSSNRGDLLSIFSDRKKIIVVDHGKEISLHSLGIVDYISGNTVKNVGDAIRILDIPLTKNQSRSINLCRKIEDFVDGEKIIINVDPHQYGVASWYGPRFQGKITANGETFNTYTLTAAHKTLPFNTMVRVFNINNNKSVVVRINDRGPFVAGRIIDLSFRAKEKLGIEQITSVYLEILDQDVKDKSCE